MNEDPASEGVGTARRSLVVVVREDPRNSARAAEGVRIAAGIAGWAEVSVDLVLEGMAAAWWRERSGGTHWVVAGEPGAELDGSGVRVIAWDGVEDSEAHAVRRAGAMARGDAVFLV